MQLAQVEEGEVELMETDDADVVTVTNGGEQVIVVYSIIKTGTR